MDKHRRTNLVNSLSGYKSANRLGAQNAQGKTNLALMSSVFHVGANPALMGCLLRPHSVPRHSLENIVETGCFTLNAVTKSFYSQAHQTSARYDRDVSEFKATGLTEEYSPALAAPYVAESPLKIGLTLAESHTLTTNETVLIVGRIVEIHFTGESMITPDGHLNLGVVDSVAISGLDEYHLPVSLGREPYPKP